MKCKEKKGRQIERDDIQTSRLTARQATIQRDRHAYKQIDRQTVSKRANQTNTMINET